MANVPIRQLGSTGVITDVSNFNLPITAFTRAKNVRFTDGQVSAGPVFRPISTAITAYVPAFCYTVVEPANYDSILIVDTTFDIFEVSAGATTQRLNGSLNATGATISAATLADVVYVNRSDTVPVARVPGATNFTTLANWPSAHKATVIRAYGDFLLALGMVEGSSSFPNRIRFSDSVTANSIPSTWDASDLTNLAGFNDLVQMQTPIMDGATLGDSFLIYSKDQVWAMEFVGGTFIFNFRKIFNDAGVISQDCIIELEGKHYVFDSDDIYVTDGQSRKSICDGRVKNYIFTGLDNSKADVCFAMHNSKTEELYFCYNSQDDMVINNSPGGFPGVPKCNRAAVYNYKEDTWTFQDLPNAVAGVEANVNTTQTYASQNTQYRFMGGSYKDFDSPFAKHPIVLSNIGPAGPTGQIVPTANLYGLDFVDTGSLPGAYDTAISRSGYLERQGLDLDELGVSLSGYKNISKVLPQISTPDSDPNIVFAFGATDTPSGPVVYEGGQSFNCSTDHKLDTRISGRYLSYKVSPQLKSFSFSGMDVEVNITGKR